MFLHDLVHFSARNSPRSEALVAGSHSWSFSELSAAVNAMAQSLESVSDRGSTVAVVAENTPGFVTALYAVPQAGNVLAMGNTRHSDTELLEMIKVSRATTVLATRPHIDRLESAGIDAEITMVELLPESLGAEFPPQSGTPLSIGGSDSDTAWLIHTSGTTGKAKGAMLTHRSIISAALNTTMSRPIAADEVYLFPFPLFHVAAYNVIHHHLRRRPVVLLPSFEPVAAMKAIETHRVTAVSLAPTMVAMLLDHPERGNYDLSSLRQISYGAAAMPLDLLRRTLDELPKVGLAQGYGMTELSGNAVFLGPEEHRRAASTEPEILSAAGRPAPLAALKIVGDDDAEVAAGDVGEILVKSDQVCAGYWENPSATADAFIGDWFRTGDVGRIDSAGYLHVVDRKKDIIITGGENVSSREVEDALSTHPAVAQVAVIGTPDERWGELVTAAIVLAPGVEQPTVEEIRDWTPALARFKRPRQLFVVDEMPLNASGKIEKRRLRDSLP